MLSRRIGDGIVIGDQVEVLIHSVEKGKIRVGINAPQEIPVRRAELEPREDGRRVRGRFRAAEAAGAGSERPARGKRRRVIIDPSGTTTRERGGERMLREALRDTPVEVLEAVAQGDAVDRRIRRALMELAREELLQREPHGHRAAAADRG